MKIINITLALITGFYLMFHIGRYYEHQQLKGIIRKLDTITADYIIPSGRYEGELATGNCITNPSYQGFLTYTGLDF